jgi:hypothetical protein
MYPHSFAYLVIFVCLVLMAFAKIVYEGCHNLQQLMDDEKS